MNNNSPLPPALLAKETELRALLDKVEVLLARLRANLEPAFEASEAEAARRFEEARTELRDLTGRAPPEELREREARAAERERLRKAEALQKHEAARLRLDHAEKRLLELNAQAPRSPGPGVRPAGDDEASPVTASVVELEKMFDEAERGMGDLAAAKAAHEHLCSLQQTWRDAAASYAAAIDDLESKTARQESPALIHASVKAFKKAEAIRNTAAREASVSPDETPGMWEAE